MITKVNVQQSDTPNLKIKRMSKSKNTRGGNSQRDGSKIKLNPAEISHYQSVNQSALVHNSTALHHETNNESLLIRDM